MAVAIGERAFAADPTFRPGFVDLEIPGGFENTGIDHKGVGAGSDIALRGDINTSPNCLHAIGQNFAAAGFSIAVAG